MQYTVYTPDVVAAIEVQHNLIFEQGRQIPGSVHYTIKRYLKPAAWMTEDTGMFNYHYEKNRPQENYVELRFCIAGNMYCKQAQQDCGACKAHATANCNQKVKH